MKLNRYMQMGIIGLGMMLAACKPAPSEETGSVAVKVEGVVLSTGTFEGRNEHVVTGGVEIVESGGKFVVNLGSDFSLDNAPDPKVGLGKDGYQKSTKAGALSAKTGASSYELPAGVDPADYNEVYIWCDKFDVPLGVAKLTAK